MAKRNSSTELIVTEEFEGEVAFRYEILMSLDHFGCGFDEDHATEVAFSFGFCCSDLAIVEDEDVLSEIDFEHCSGDDGGCWGCGPFRAVLDVVFDFVGETFGFVEGDGLADVVQVCVECGT